MPCRRQFLRTIPLTLSAGIGLCATLASTHASAALLGEQDPAARKLGYAADTATVNDRRFPGHKTSQRCANCQLYQGDKGSAAGGCVLFGDKEVAAAGWCSAWAEG